MVTAGEAETERIASCSKSKTAVVFEAALRDLWQVLQRILVGERHTISAAAAACGISGGDRSAGLAYMPAEDRLHTRLTMDRGRR
jgi:hypothetical protein